jgi:hypothetical protein
MVFLSSREKDSVVKLSIQKITRQKKMDLTSDNQYKVGASVTQAMSCDEHTCTI